MVGRARRSPACAGIRRRRRHEATSRRSRSCPARPGSARRDWCASWSSRCPPTSPRSGCTAQPGSMGRPLDAVAGLAPDSRRRPAPRCSTWSRRPSPWAGRARHRGPPLDRHRQRQPHRPHRPAAVAEPGHHRHVSARRAVAGASPAASSCCASSAATRSSRSASTGSTAPRSAAMVAAIAGDRRPAVVGVRRGAAPAQRRRPVRRRGADARRRARSAGVASCSTPSCRGRWRRRCASSSPGSTTAERAVVEALAVYGRAASFEALLLVTEADERRPARRPAGAASRGVSWSRSATTSSGSPTPSSPTPSSTSCSAASGAGCTSAASRPCARRRCSTTPRWPTTPAAPTATTRCRRSPARGAPGTSRRAHVLGPAPGRRGSRPRRRTIPSCWPSPPRRRGGSTSSTRRSATAQRWGEGRRRAGRPHRGAALRRPAAPRARRRGGGAGPLGELEALADARRRRSCAGAAACVAGPAAHDRRPLVEAVAWADRALADARAVGDDAHRGPGARSSGPSAHGRRRQPGRGARAMHEALDAARRVGDAVLLTPGDQQRPRARAVALAEAAGAAGRDAGRQLAGRLRQARHGGDAAVGVRRPPSATATCRRCAGSPPKASQWWGRPATSSKWVSRGAGRVRPGGGPARPTPPRPTSGLVAGCPCDKRQHYLRLDIALAAATRRPRGRAGGCSRSCSPAPMLLDVGVDAQRRRPCSSRTRSPLGVAAGRDPRPGCSTGGWASTRRAAAIRAHAEGLLLARRGRPRSRRRGARAVLAEPDPCLAKPVIGTLRTALAEALLGAGDRAGALVAVRRAIDDDLGPLARRAPATAPRRWPGGCRGVDARRRRADRRASGRSRRCSPTG